MTNLQQRARLAGIASGLAAFAIAVSVFALEGPPPVTEVVSGPPAGVKGGPPSQEAMAAFEKQFGAPPTDFTQAGPPPFEAPGDIPAEAKQYLSDSEIVAIACAYTRWKTGEFFSAMEALKANLIPAVQKLNAVGLKVPVPNTDGFIAEGQRRVNDVCASPNYDVARTRIMDFDGWSRATVQSSFDKMRDSMQAQMQARGEGVKAKVNAAIAPLIAAGQKDIEAQMKAYANAKATEFAASKSPPSQAAFEAEMNAKAQQLADELQARIEAQAKTAAGAEMGPLQEMAGLMEGLQEKIQAAIEAGKANYESYHQQALALRKAAVLKAVDASLAEASAKLDAAAASMDAARAADPNVPVVADVKSALAADRATLASALDAALAADDETAIQAAVDAFRGKWEGIQRQMEEHAGAAVGQICSTAKVQFAAARAQYSAAIAQLSSVEAACKGSISDDCQMLAPYRDNFGLLTEKLTALNAAMATAEAMCAKATLDDRATLIAVLMKIKSDGEDVQNLGTALDLEKRDQMVTTVQQACDAALPELTQAQSDMQTEDLVALKDNLAECAGLATPACVAVNQTKPRFNDFQAKVAAFGTQVDRVEALCAAPGDEASLDAVTSTLSLLEEQSSALQESGAALQADEAQKSSGAAFCGAMGTQLDFMRQDALANVDEMDTMLAECAGVQNDFYCARVQAMSSSLAALKTRTKTLLGKMDQLDVACAKPTLAPPAATLVTLANGIEADAAKLKADVDALGLKVDKAARGTGIWIEAEAEAKAEVLPVDSRPAPNLKETNPSWRPPYFGTGDWYLAAAGENLQYRFSTPKAGKYFVWIRDYVDRFQPVGVRRVNVVVSGQDLGTFPEVALVSSGDRGTFGWHMVATVDLPAGAQTMKVTKEETTSGAAILDAYYLTTGLEVPPEK